MFGQPSAMLVPDDGKGLGSSQNLKIGVVLSGGQAPGGHNDISGIYGSIFNLIMLLIELVKLFKCFGHFPKYDGCDPFI